MGVQIQVISFNTIVEGDVQLGTVLPFSILVAFVSISAVYYELHIVRIGHRSEKKCCVIFGYNKVFS